MITTERKWNWLQTYSGVQFYPLDPRVDEIDILDIAHALSNICRFGGHCRTFYSVAEHSINCSFEAKEEFKLAALLHDATEAYLVDVPRPIKSSLTNYREIEQNLAIAIAQRFTPVGAGWLDFDNDAVHEVDDRMLMTEAAQLLGPHPAPWGNEALLPYDIKLGCWTPAQAKMKFIDRFTTLYHAHNLYY